MSKTLLRSFICTTFLFLTIAIHSFAQKTNEDAYEYINTYKELAIHEQIRTNIPAAIKLAQGILESSSGYSELAINANAHFGIKCKSNWTGMTYMYDDDKKNECFRKYESAMDSYKDHSDFLKNNKRYESLFQLDINDYKGWAHGLKKCGYATNPKYADKLIEVIEKYNLQDITIEAIALSKELQNTNSNINSNHIVAASTSLPPSHTVTTNTVIESPTSEISITPSGNNPINYYKLTSLNGLKGFYARKGDMLLQYAVEFDIRYAKLLSINELEDAPLNNDMFIYLDKKRTKGIQETDVLGENETLHEFSQRHGIQMGYLLKYNHLKPNEIPKAGSVLYLQTNAPKKPELSDDLFVSNTSTTNTFTKTYSDNDFIHKPIIKNNSPISTSSQTTLNESNTEVKTISNTTEKPTTSIDVKPTSTEIKKDEIVSSTPSVRENTQSTNTNTTKNQDELDHLIKQFDQTIHVTNSNTSNPEVQKHFQGKDAPQQFSPEELNKNNTSNKNNTINKGNTTNKNTTPPTQNTPSKGFPLRSNPNELLSKHMNNVRNNPDYSFTQKATGIEHTSAPTPTKPKTNTKSKTKSNTKNKTTTKSKPAPKKTTTNKKKK